MTEEEYWEEMRQQDENERQQQVHAATDRLQTMNDFIALFCNCSTVFRFQRKGDAWTQSSWCCGEWVEKDVVGELTVAEAVVDAIEIFEFKPSV